MQGKTQHQISIYGKLMGLFFACSFILLSALSLSSAAPLSYDATTTWMIPDLSQYATPLGSGPYCAPTAATNALWAFYVNGDTTLIQPGATDTNKADNTITTLAGVAYMSTNPAGGTNTSDIITGLQNYANANGTAQYTVSLLTAFNTGTGGGIGDGLTLWNAMMDEIYNGAMVMPIISFIAPPMSGAEVLELDIDYQEGMPAMGHMVTMTGYDDAIPEIQINDPFNNSSHVLSPPEKAASSLQVVHPTSIEITIGPYIAKHIIGAVVLSPVAAPPPCFIQTIMPERD